MNTCYSNVHLVSDASTQEVTRLTEVFNFDSRGLGVWSADYNAKTRFNDLLGWDGRKTETCFGSWFVYCAISPILNGPNWEQKRLSSEFRREALRRSFTKFSIFTAHQQDRKMSRELQKIPFKKCVQNFGNHILGRPVRKLDDTLEGILNRWIVETKVGWKWFAIIPLAVLALDEILGFQQQTVGTYRILRAFNFIRFWSIVRILHSKLSVHILQFKRGLPPKHMEGKIKDNYMSEVEYKEGWYNISFGNFVTTRYNMKFAKGCGTHRRWLH